MPKSDDTRYASEIPTLLAWNPKYQDPSVDKAIQIALKTRSAEYNRNLAKALRHKSIIEQDMKKRGFAPVRKVSWQANFNRNNNGSPADTVFNDHETGGVSVKCGSDIIGNYGTAEFDKISKRLRGEDLFRHLAQPEFDALLLAVKQSLLARLKKIGDYWTAERESDYGKYKIQRTGKDEFELTFAKTTKKFTRDQLLTEYLGEKKQKDGTIKIKKLPGKWRRVFGDYYQSTKKDYSDLRMALYAVLYPKIEKHCKDQVFADAEKLYQLGGFTELPYYVSDLHNDCVYFVPSKHEIKKLITEILDKDSSKSFGSGFELKCSIRLTKKSQPATLDYYVCYNSGTFNRGPVIKIQNFQNKQNLWQLIS